MPQKRSAINKRSLYIAHDTTWWMATLNPHRRTCGLFFATYRIMFSWQRISETTSIIEAYLLETYAMRKLCSRGSFVPISPWPLNLIPLSCHPALLLNSKWLDEIALRFTHSPELLRVRGIDFSKSIVPRLEPCLITYTTEDISYHNLSFIQWIYNLFKILLNDSKFPSSINSALISFL